MFHDDDNHYDAALDVCRPVASRGIGSNYSVVCAALTLLAFFLFQIDDTGVS